MSKSSLKVARRYAKALFDLCDKAKLDEMKSALVLFESAWKTNETLRGSMLNPAFPLDNRLAALSQICRQIKPGDQAFENFLALLLKNKRLAVISPIIAEFSAMIDLLKNLLTLEVTSAFELSDQERSSMLSKIQSDCGAMAAVNWKVDRQILGGLLIKAGDKLLDGSIRGSLQRAREQLLG
ncbi:MAG: ATP synthase F1 subunit delta [Oligoflexia bacterium]|nr:ATP synthase F1 subunit delta [Oligoflexia bacterium]